MSRASNYPTRAMNIVRDLAICLLALAALVSSGCVATPVKVEGAAMRPTFYDGDRLLMSSNIDRLERFDVIYFKAPMDETRIYLKRVVGLPGERLEIVDRVIKINGEPISQPFLDQEYDQAKASAPETTIAADEFFVMGDNRDNSSDSRYWGTVPRSMILGKYYSTYYKAARK